MGWPRAPTLPQDVGSTKNTETTSVIGRYHRNLRVSILSKESNTVISTDFYSYSSEIIPEARGCAFS